MAQRITIDPITRIEGHLKIEVETKNGRVTEAWSAGEMFRGLEKILIGRHPVDAQHIMQRICGVCPAAHAQAATLCLDSAYGITPPDNGRLIRNLILGANYIQSHILHFYHLAALDYVDITAVAQYTGGCPEMQRIKGWVLNALEQAKAGEPVAVGPFLPRYEGDYYIKDTAINLDLIAHYIMALKARRQAHEMLALFGGRMPHEIAIAPGGASQQPTVDKIISYQTRLAELIDFVDRVYLPDVLALASLAPGEAKEGIGEGNYLSYGVFEESNDGAQRFFPAGVVRQGKLEKFDHTKIVEDVKYARFSSPSGRYPHEGATEAAPEKKGAYTWVKAPRYNKEAMEVGPLARMMVAYLSGHEQVKPAIDGALQKLSLNASALNSTAGRHLARALEASIVAHKLNDFLAALKPDQPFHTPANAPQSGKGIGLTEAARGALGHWIVIENGKIANYQAVVPTTWNASPRDDRGKPGPIEIALVGTAIKNEAAPLEAARVVRAYDPCLACAIHTVEAGEVRGIARVC